MDKLTQSTFRAAALIAVASLSWSTPGAELTEQPRSLTGAYSSYEERVTRLVEARFAAVRDPAPEGKQIEAIEVVTLPPIEANDPAPAIINAIHRTTVPYVIERELLVRRGESYRKALVDETTRNLRKLPQISLVLCVPIQGTRTGAVRLILVTKDVWSLYADFDVSYSGGALEGLLLEPKESNFAGRHQVVLGRVLLHPETLALGTGYKEPRLVGRRMALSVDANLIFNRHHGGQEGSWGSLIVEKPLYTTRSRWAWFVSESWRHELVRRYINGRVATYGEGAELPYAYRTSSNSIKAAVTRSFGWVAKNDVTILLRFDHHDTGVPGAGMYNRATVEDFERTVVPPAEARVGPVLEWHLYANDFLRTYNSETLGLQEDVHLGYDVLLRAFAAPSALGSTRNLVGTYGALQYTAPLANGFARGTLESGVEGVADDVSDLWARSQFRVTTPSLGIGRLVLHQMLLHRYRNYLNALTYIGGTGQLRGYPSRYLAGKDAVALNLEFRTKEVEIASMQLGCVGFYDVADAFDGFDRMRPKHSLGFGLRAVIPALDRSVFRIDVGIPVSSQPLLPNVAPVAVHVGFGQAFRLQSVSGLKPPSTSANAGR